jgi:light-regulated signal transduction histidine kinase (bacteriophytochrome)
MNNSELIPENDILTDLTSLNNELVNAQRALSKKHIEIIHLNKKLLSANADLEEFTNAASHDLNEPLRMVVSFMTMLKAKYSAELDVKANSYIDFALDGGKRMQKMVTALLELSRTSRKDSPKELLNLGGLVTESIQNLKYSIESTGTILMVASELPELLVNKTDMIRLFQNLFSNAIKFRRAGVNPVIKLCALEKENEWLFSIEDNGIGIPKEKLHQVFEIFRRLHSKEEYEGTGIGLSTCKKIVEHYSGIIWVESEGNGSTFYFTIPKN